MGGGLEIALACHLIVADERAELALSEVQVGLIAGAGGLVRLPRQLPTKVADEMILTGRRMGAQEALDRGLVNVVTGAGEAMTGARELAAQIMRGSPTSVRISLQVMEETASIVDPIDAVTQPSTAFDDLMFSEDTSEGLAAFSAKRAPQWRNR
ncbi:MAG: enoyl-CoA hydratase-related protein [Mycetocola sp.]